MRLKRDHPEDKLLSGGSIGSTGTSLSLDVNIIQAPEVWDLFLKVQICLGCGDTRSYFFFFYKKKCNLSQFCRVCCRVVWENFRRIISTFMFLPLWGESMPPPHQLPCPVVLLNFSV